MNHTTELRQLHSLRAPLRAAADWDAPVKSIDWLEASDEITCAGASHTATDAVAERTQSECGPPHAAERRDTIAMWTLRWRTLEERMNALLEAVATAPRTPGLLTLRRLRGGMTTIAESVRAVLAAPRGAPPAERGAPARFVECTMWWLSRFVADLEAAIAKLSYAPADVDAAVHGAASFAVLYALGQLDVLHGAAHADVEPREAEVLAQLHEDVMWLALQLRDATEP